MYTANCYFLKELPDLTLSKYQQQDASSVGDLLNLQTHFLRQWHSICGLLELSLHFIVSVDKSQPKGAQLDVCLMLRGTAGNLKNAEILLTGSSLSKYYTLERNSEKETRLQKQTFAGVAALSKGERVSVLTDETNYTFVPGWEMNDKCRLMDAIRVMESLDGNTVYRVDVYPVNLAEKTRQNFAIPIKTLKNPQAGKDLGSFSFLQKDYATQDTLKQYEEWLKQLETTPHFRANIYAFADDDISAKLVLSSAASEALEEGEKILWDKVVVCPDIDSLSPFWDLDNENSSKAKSYYSEGFSVRYKDWTTTFTLDELATFLRFPALYEGETIELRKETAIDTIIKGLLLAHDKNGHEVRFPIKQFEKHAFICGVPGSGKTNSMLHITSSLWKKEHIPFLVFEPAKKEYRTLFNDPAMREDLMLFSLCAGTKLPLMLNPFEFPEGMSLSEHIAAIMKVFSGSFYLNGTIYNYLDRAIERAYADLGWEYDDVNDGTRPYPTLGDVKVNYEKEAAKTKYVGDNKGIVQEFLTVRLSGLMVREMGELFNAKESSLKPEQWLEKPIIIELEALSESSCNFLILLLCTLIRETLKVDAQSNAYNSLRHVIFIEEAHNLIAPDSQQSTSDDVDPKVSATAYLAKMLAEVRALHEGIVIADQLPSAIASEIMKNTGLKIVHRMTAKDDRDMVGSTMAATEAQLEQLVTYSTGDALLFYEGLQLPFYAKTCHWEDGIFEGKTLPNDEIFSLISDDNAVIIANSLINLLGSFYDSYEKASDESSLMINQLKSVSPRDYKAFTFETESTIRRTRELFEAFTKKAKEIERRFPYLLTRLTDEELRHKMSNSMISLEEGFNKSLEAVKLKFMSQGYDFTDIKL